MSDSADDGTDEAPKGLSGGVAIRSVLNAASGAIPFAGGILSAIASAWSEHEQAKVNSFFEHWLQMLQADMAEKAQTILEIMARLDMHDQKTSERVESPQYQSLVRKAFRDWAGAESEEKRQFVRNILAHAADASLASDDVIRLFLQWINTYSEMHFAVVGTIYNNAGITRKRMWERIGRAPVREDSADADLFKLLIRDLSTGGIIRQHRETDYHGNFLRKSTPGRTAGGGSSSTMKSAFDDVEGYELTELGQRFVHYAMTEVPPRIGFHPQSGS